jgi:RNA polymerase subunit RPABC4/transcription elongation factor Spt4
MTSDGQGVTISSATPSGVQGDDLSALRRYDANFSEIVFRDFCYSLFARVHDARGGGRLDDYAPYVSAPIREGMKRHAFGLTSVDEIVIGSFVVGDLQGLSRSTVTTDVEFEANFTENRGGVAQRWYLVERWSLERARDILSPAPEKAKAEHCPKCGAPLQTQTDGSCLHCGTVIKNGAFHWFVRSIQTMRKEQRPPALTGGGVEEGTNLPTIYEPQLHHTRLTFVAQRPGFAWEAFESRVRLVATELQAAWASRDWHRARPFETDALFQMHRYWIDEYLRQDLRNPVDDFTIERMEVVKVISDAFYDAITVRLFASGRDYTVTSDGAIVGGSKTETRYWSEYWTLVRGRSAVAAESRVCPNCGGSLPEGQTAICGYCGGKVTTADFPWILSRIEQDDSYRG